MFDRYKKSSIEIKVFFIVIIRMIVNNIRNVSCLWSKQLSNYPRSFLETADKLCFSGYFFDNETSRIMPF